MTRSISILHWACIGAGAGLLLMAMAATDFAFAEDPPIASPPVTSPAAQAEAKKLDALPPVPSKGNAVAVDQSGRKETGNASIYSRSFDGKEMADGKRYNPKTAVAASKTLPLGTVAKVTNLENGKSTEVKVEDRGPFVSGRVVDLTPQAAGKLGLTQKEGIAPVVVAPVTVPQKDGSVKLGAGAVDHAPAAAADEEVANAGRGQ